MSKRDPHIKEAANFLYMSQGIPMQITSIDLQIEILRLKKCDPCEIQALMATRDRLIKLNDKISSFIKTLTKEHQKIIDLLILQKIPWADVCQEMNISKSNLFSKRKLILSQLVDYFKICS